MNEKELKEVGEHLAEAAAEAGVGSKQLRGLYRLAKTRPTPFFEAFVKRQISRASKGRRGGPIGFDRFGPVMLDIMERIGENKADLQKALMYANMLCDYTKMTLTRGGGGAGWREKLDPIVGQFCSRFGYAGITLEDERGRLLCRVRLRRFRGNPAAIASDLTHEVLSHFPELTGSIRFWIETTERR